MKEDKRQEGEKFTQPEEVAFDFRIVWGIIFAVIMFVALVLGKYFLDVVLLVSGSILFAVILRIPGDWIHHRTRLPRRLATVLSLVLLLGMFVLLGFLIAPNISRQTERISNQVPLIVNQLESNLRTYPWAQQVIKELKNVPSSLTEMGGVGNILEQVSGIFTGAFGFAANLVIFVVLAIYFAYEPRSYIEGLVRLIPPEDRQRAREVLTSVGDALKWWLIGRVIAMFILGSLVGVGLFVIGVPLALSLGMITGLLSFVPIIGGVIAFFPAGFVALAESPLMLFYVFLLYLGAQTVENYLLTPIVQRQTVSLAPAVALVIQLVMGLIAGPAGIALAYPVAVVGQVFVRELYIEDFLEGRS